MSTVLIFNNRKAAIDAEKFASYQEGLEISGTKNLFFDLDSDRGLIHHPDDTDDRVAVHVPEVFQGRSWYNDFENKADEVVEELSEDWFEDDEENI